MAETIKAGTILIKDGTFLPDALQFESEPCVAGLEISQGSRWATDWIAKSTKRDGPSSCLAGEIKAIVFGFEGAKEGSQGRQANLGEIEVGEIQFFGNHASELARNASWECPM